MVPFCFFPFFLFGPPLFAGAPDNHTADGRTPAPPKKAWFLMVPLVNTHKRYGFPWFQRGAKWISPAPTGCLRFEMTALSPVSRGCHRVTTANSDEEGLLGTLFADPCCFSIFFFRGSPFCGGRGPGLAASAHRLLRLGVSGARSRPRHLPPGLFQREPLGVRSKLGKQVPPNGRGAVFFEGTRGVKEQKEGQMGFPFLTIYFVVFDENQKEWCPLRK